MEDDEWEWDLATIQELDRIEQQASAAKRTQAASAHSPECVDEWDVGALEMEEARRQSGHVLTEQKILDPERTPGASHGTETLNCSGKISGPQYSEVLKRTIPESSGCGLSNTVQAEDSSFHESNDSQLSYKLHRIWCQDMIKEAGSELLAKLFTTCETEIYALLRFEDSGTQSQNSSEKSARDEKTNLRQSIRALWQGGDVQYTLMCSLMKFLYADNTQTVRSALRVLRCLFMNSKTCRQKRDTLDYSDSLFRMEAEGIGWKLQTSISVLYNPSAASRLTFCSPRITSNVPSHVSERQNEGYLRDERSKAEEGLLDVLRCLLRVAITHPESGVKLEALSLITMFVAQTNPLRERRWVACVLIEGRLTSLLKTHASDVQLQVVRIVHLLLNCPEVVDRICYLGTCIETSIGQSTSLERDGKDVLDSVSICLLHKGETIEDHYLRKSALQVLDYVMSTCKHGAAALVTKLGCREQRKAESHSLSNIGIQLISVLDWELTLEGRKKQNKSRETGLEDRPSLLPAALKLLFQLSVHADYSSTVISFLSEDGEVARRSLNVINRLISLGWKSPRSVKKPFQPPPLSVQDMAKGLKCRILSNLRSFTDASVL